MRSRNGDVSPAADANAFVSRFQQESDLQRGGSFWDAKESTSSARIFEEVEGIVEMRG